MPKKGKGKRKRKRSAASKSRTISNKKLRAKAVGGSKLLHPKHNKVVDKQQLQNYMCDPVVAELEVACKCIIDIKGPHSHFELMGRKSKAISTFEVRDYSKAHVFRERGVDQLLPAFRPNNNRENRGVH
jgi:hypothetical protein